MATLLRESKHIAKKTYGCDACCWLDNFSIQDFLAHCQPTYGELRTVAKARRNCWRILPGQEYITRVSVSGGELYVFRAIPEIDAICHKYEIYDYDW